NGAVGHHMLEPSTGRTGASEKPAPQAARRQARSDFGAPHMGVGNDPPSACAYDCAWRRVLSGWATLDRLPVKVLFAGARALTAVPPSVYRGAVRRSCRRAAYLFRGARGPCRCQGFRSLPQTLASLGMGGLCEEALWRTRSGA